MSETTPRITPLEQPQWDEFLARLVDASGGPDHALNIFTTLGRHPKLFQSWIRFGAALLGGELSARMRELVILRTSVNCEAPYEWAHHEHAARAAGVTGAELDALRGELDGAALGADDVTVLGAVDELHERWTLSDETWAAVHGLLGDVATIELLMLVGQYHLVALSLRTLQVQIER